MTITPVNDDAPCLICGAKKGCCIDDKGIYAICLNKQAGSINTKGGRHLHRLKGGKSRSIALPFSKTIVRERIDALNPVRLTAYAQGWRVKERTLVRLGIGYDVETDSATFPMYDGNRRAVGIRMIGDDSAFMAGGGINGLFIAEDYETQTHDVPSLLTEGALLMIVAQGPIATAMILDKGLRCVGMPSPSGSNADLAILLSLDSIKQDIILLMDNLPARRNESGEMVYPAHEGVIELSDRIVGKLASRLRLWRVPPPATTLEEYAAGLGTVDIVCDILGAAVEIDQEWIDASRRKVEAMKRQLRKG